MLEMNAYLVCLVVRLEVCTNSGGGSEQERSPNEEYPGWKVGSGYNTAHKQKRKVKEQSIDDTDEVLYSGRDGDG